MRTLLLILATLTAGLPGTRGELVGSSLAATATGAIAASASGEAERTRPALEAVDEPGRDELADTDLEEEGPDHNVEACLTPPAERHLDLVLRWRWRSTSPHPLSMGRCRPPRSPPRG